MQGQMHSVFLEIPEIEPHSIYSFMSYSFCSSFCFSDWSDWWMSLGLLGGKFPTLDFWETMTSMKLGHQPTEAGLWLLHSLKLEVGLSAHYLWQASGSTCPSGSALGVWLSSDSSPRKMFRKESGLKLLVNLVPTFTSLSSLLSCPLKNILTFLSFLIVFSRRVFQGHHAIVKTVRFIKKSVMSYLDKWSWGRPGRIW